MQTRTLILILSFLTLKLIGQDIKAEGDSLRNCIDHCDDESDRINALIKYTYSLEITDAQRNIAMIDSALQRHRTGDSIQTDLLLPLLHNLSLNYFNLNEYLKSKDISRKILALASHVGDSAHMIKANNNLYILNYRLTMPDSALYYLNENYALLQHSSDTFTIGSNLNGLALYYRDKGDYERSLTYFNQYKDLAESTTTNRAQMRQAVYGNLGALYRKMEQADSAIFYLEKTLELNSEHVGALNDLGLLYKGQGNFYKALEYFNRLYTSESVQANEYYLSAISNNIADTYVLLKAYGKALPYARQGGALAEKIGRSSFLVSSYTSLVGAYKGLGEYRKALEISEKLDSLNDVIEGESVKEHIAELETTYELKEKTTALELEQARNEVQQLELNRSEARNRWLLALGVLLLIIAAVVIFYNRRLSKARKELATANTVKDRFFAIISHEMLGTVSSFSGIGPILSDMANDKDYEGIRELSGDLENESLRLKRMLDNLLQWAFLQLDRINMKSEKLYLRQLIMERQKELERSIASKNIHLELDLAEHFVQADRNATAFILRNFIANAIKFSHPGGRLFIESKRLNGKVAITVKDEGAGMSAETQKALFDLSKTVSHTGTAGEQGNGLGLILSKEFAERNHGRLEVSSREGQGSTFRLLLPAG